MPTPTNLARARVQTVEVLRAAVRRLNEEAALQEITGNTPLARGLRYAVDVMLRKAMDIADDLARERAQTEEERTDA